MNAAEYAPSSLASRFDRHLGDPNARANLFYSERCIALDETDQFPNDIICMLNEWGLQKYYVPVQYGGLLRYFEDPIQLIRMVARRDLTVAIAHGKTFLGGICAWFASDAAQAGKLAQQILAGYPVSLALTERDHGSDLMADEVNATAVPGGFLVNGEKWLINNATRGRLLTVLVRTKAGHGARGFDLMIVDKAELASATYSYLPKELTNGIRGADISGVRFNNAFIPDSNVIGSPGSGLETLLKALQITRTLCTSLSLGAGDQALRIATRFAEERVLYGRRLMNLPHARRVLLDAYADQLLAEILTLVGSRSAHALPGEMSLVSAIVKALVPTRTDRMISGLARFLGARSFLLDVFAGGMYQKVQRDNRIVALFDGNTVISLQAIVNQFSVIGKGYQRGVWDMMNESTCDLTALPPAFDPNRFSLLSRPGVSTLNAMPDSVAALEKLASGRTDLRETVLLVRRMASICELVIRRLMDQKPSRMAPAASFHLAENCALCYAAAAALGVWLNTHVREDHETFKIWINGAWLNAVYVRLLNAFGDDAAVSQECDEAMMSVLQWQASQGRLFSLLSCPLAESERNLC